MAIDGLTGIEWYQLVANFVTLKKNKMLGIGTEHRSLIDFCYKLLK